MNHIEVLRSVMFFDGVFYFLASWFSFFAVVYLFYFLHLWSIDRGFRLKCLDKEIDYVESSGEDSSS